MKDIILLVDMDGVIADYYGGFCIEWAKRYPDRKVVPAGELESFYLEDAYPKEWGPDILSITRGKGFFENLPPVKDAVRALQFMKEKELLNIFICTAPDVDCEDQCCPSEKLKWIEKHLGKDWLKKTIITPDKTLIKGHFLIDDKPVITGVAIPSWERIFFTHKYNEHLPGKRMDGWMNLRKGSNGL